MFIVKCKGEAAVHISSRCELTRYMAGLVGQLVRQGVPFTYDPHSYTFALPIIHSLGDGRILIHVEQRTKDEMHDADYQE